MNRNITSCSAAVSFALGVVIFSFAADDQHVLTFRAPLGNQDLWYGITVAELESTPKWTELDNSPPLSAKRAIEAGKNAIARFEEKGILKALPDILEWTLKELTLKPMDDGKWFWIVSFEASPKPGFGMTGTSLETSVLVTMNGRILTPSASEPGRERRTKD